MNKINLYCNLIACCVMVVICFISIAIFTFIGGLMGGLIGLAINLLPVIAFAMEAMKLAETEEF